MNKSLLIIVCDFTILSLLSIATFDSTAKKSQGKSPALVAQTSLQNELFQQLKLDLEQEQVAAKLNTKLLEQQKLEASKTQETQKILLDQEQNKALAQQKLLEQEQLKAKNVEADLLKAREVMLLKEKALSHATQEIDQHKLLLDQAQKEQQKLKALSEQQKLELQKKLQEQQEFVKSEQLKLKKLAEQQSESAKLLQAETERLQKELEQKLLQERLTSQEAQAQLMKSLLQKEQEQKKLVATVKLQEQQVALAELNKQHLKDVLSLTRQQMADEQKLASSVVNIENRLVEQKGAIDQALQQVVQSQQNINQNLDSFKKKSSHEIFQLATARCVTCEVKTSRQGLLGNSQSSKIFYGLPIKFADGKLRVVMHYMQSPFAWDTLNENLQQLDVTEGKGAFNSGKYNVAVENPRILLSDILPEATPAIEIHPEPQRSERIIVVDLDKKAYASFPLRWQYKSKDILTIDAALAQQVFGPLSLAPGQLIFADDGRWIGFVMQGKEGYAVGALTAKTTFNLSNLARWREEQSRREAWIKEIDPRRGMQDR